MKGTSRSAKIALKRCALAAYELSLGLIVVSIFCGAAQCHEDEVTAPVAVLDD